MCFLSDAHKPVSIGTYPGILDLLVPFAACLLLLARYECIHLFDSGYARLFSTCTINMLLINRII